MASYGSFEINRELASTEGATVYTAHKAGESANDYVVKVFSLAPHIGDSEETRAELGPLLEDLSRSFLDRVTVQKKAGEASRNVAPILESGKDERGAWYATRYYPRSVDIIIEGHVSLRKEWVLHILLSVLRGALDLKRICGRSPGSLKPANILIGGGAKTTEAEVVISDPLPGDASEAARYEIADLRAIGQIIYQLVRRRKIAEAADWMILPLESSKEWTDLFGKETKSWLAICSRLLNPQLSLAEYTLEQLEADLIALQPKPPVSPRMLAAAAGIVIVVVAGLLLVFLRPARAFVLVSSHPAPATIYDAMGKELMKTAPGSTNRFRLSPGTNVLIARYEGLESMTNVLVLAKGVTSGATFNFVCSTVELDSDPPKATVLAGETPLGTTPKRSYQKPGPVIFRWDLAGHETVTTNVTLKPNERRSFKPSLTRVGGTDSVVIITADPRGTAVFLDGQDLGEFSGTKRVSGGAHELVGKFRDWPPKRVAVELKPGERTNVNLFFDYGVVDLDSDPLEARVSVGTHWSGITPTNMISATGPVTFRFEKPGYDETNVTANVPVYYHERTPVGKRVLVKPALVTQYGFLELSSELTPVLIEGLPQKDWIPASGVLSKTLKPGAYVLSASYTNLLGQLLTLPKLSVNVEKRQTNRYPIPFDYGTVQFTLTPTNATLMSGGREIRPGPIPLVSGRPNPFEISAPGYETVITNVTVQRREKREVRIELARESGRVVLSSDPPNASVYAENGVSLGIADGTAKSLASGQRRLVARHPQHPQLDPVTNTFVVVKAVASSNAFSFNYGTLRLGSVPSGAKVFNPSSGQLMGTTPTNLYLKPGPITYRFEVDTNRVDKSTTVVAGALAVLEATFLGAKGAIYSNSVGMEMVALREGFWVSRFEVTQEQYRQVMSTNTVANAKPNQPVTMVGWTNAQTFCNMLTQAATEKARLDGLLIKNAKYRLPTEVEWAGFAPPDDANSMAEAVFRAGLQNDPKEIDANRKSSNGYGLFDLYGNVEEWCQGANQPVTLGGSYMDLRKPPATVQLFRNPTVLNILSAGNKRIGFRCVMAAQ